MHYKIFNHLVILIQPACSRQYTELLTAEPLTVASCRLKTHLGAREASLHLTHVPPPCPCCVDKRASAPRTDLTPAAEGCGKKHARHKGHVIRYSAPVSRRRLPSFDPPPPPTPGLGGGGRGRGRAPCDPASRRRLQVQSQVAGTCRCRPSALRCRRGPVASWCRRVCLAGLEGLGVEPESEALSRGLPYLRPCVEPFCRWRQIPRPRWTRVLC